MDLFAKLRDEKGPLGQYQDYTHEYFTYPILEGELSSRMMFRGKEKICWSLNNYLGLGNHPEVRKADADASAEYGLAYPMGSRMMSGNTKLHYQLEEELAAFVGKEACQLVNFGYQGMVSAIDCLVNRHDVIVYDAESHACIMDGMRLHVGKRFVYQHNDMESLAAQLERATKIVEKTGGGILVITEGVFGMAGDQGKLKEIVALKEKFEFRFLVDDAHGFGTLGERGSGAAELQGCIDGVDVYFGTFAKSMASIGAFFCADQYIIDYLRYNARSQIFAKSLPMPLVKGALKRLELLQTKPELKEHLWHIATSLQNGLRERGFNLGRTNSVVTPVYLEGEMQEHANLIFDLRENYHIFCSAVMYPVIPKGLMMLRLIPTAMHTDADVNETLEAFKAVSDRLKDGYYSDKVLVDFSHENQTV